MKSVAAIQGHLNMTNISQIFFLAAALSALSGCESGNSQRLTLAPPPPFVQDTGSYRVLASASVDEEMQMIEPAAGSEAPELQNRFAMASRCTQTSFSGHDDPLAYEWNNGRIGLGLDGAGFKARELSFEGVQGNAAQAMLSLGINLPIASKTTCR